jgi:hypothetical protein
MIWESQITETESDNLSISESSWVSTVVRNFYIPFCNNILYVISNNVKRGNSNENL